MKELKNWKKLLIQALKTNDINFAIYCDQMINKLKQNNNERYN